MNNTLRATTIALGYGLILMLVGCTNTPPTMKVDVSEITKDSTYDGGALESIMVMMLYSDADYDTRSMIETAFAKQLRENGINAVAGYHHFDEYDTLEQRVEEGRQRLADAGIDGVIFLDPIKVVDYDPVEFAARRALYRALGMDSAAFVLAINGVATRNASAKVILGVSLWSAEQNLFPWQATYDIKAPHNYDAQYLQHYSGRLADDIAKRLREEGLLY